MNRREVATGVTLQEDMNLIDDPYDYRGKQWGKESDNTW